jgi:hypothetical protein
MGNLLTHPLANELKMAKKTKNVHRRLEEHPLDALADDNAHGEDKNTYIYTTAGRLRHKGIHALPKQWCDRLSRALAETSVAMGGVVISVRLSLYRNKISDIHTGVALGSLGANLVQLDLGRNRLRSLPGGCVSKLLSLEELHLDHNHLEELPESVGKLTQLRILSAGSNLLYELPDTLTDLIRLSVLDVRENEITALPEGMGKLEHLVELNVEMNKLSSLPE